MNMLESLVSVSAFDVADGGTLTASGNSLSLERASIEGASFGQGSGGSIILDFAIASLTSGKATSRTG